MTENSKGSKNLNKIFDVTPTPETEIVEVKRMSDYNQPVIPGDDADLNEDMGFVKSRLKDLIAQSTQFTEFAMEIAESTQDSKDLSVVLDSIKTQSTLLSKLISIQKKDPKPEEPSQSITNNTIVFQGNANDALKQIRDKEK